MKKKIILATLLILQVSPKAAQAQDWTASAALSSDYRLRGVSLSKRQASEFVDLAYGLDTGWNFGLGLAALGRDSEGRRSLLNARVARAWQWNADWDAELAAAHQTYPGSAQRHAYDYDELSASLHWRGLWSGSLAVSPDLQRSDGYGNLYRGRALSAETALRLPLGQGLALDAGIGVYTLSSDGLTSYVYGNAGLSWNRGPAQASLSYITSNAHAQGLASAANAAGAWVGTLGWSF